jgi:hypothetical protein
MGLPLGKFKGITQVSKSILRARYEALFDTDHPGPAMEPASVKGRIAPEILAASLSRRPFLLIGDVGVGKTTFIRNLMLIEAADVFKSCIPLYIDLGSKAALSMDIRAFVLSDLKTQLGGQGVKIDERGFVRGVYNIQLQDFANGIYGDLKGVNAAAYLEKELAFLGELVGSRAEHLKRSLEHIAKGQRKQIVIFLDNADQRNPTIQQEAFLIAHELAQDSPAMVFVTLRPETFHHSTRKGALSGYHAKAFTIAPPRIDQVVEKRLAFALKFTSGEIPLPSLGRNVEINLHTLGQFIQILRDSLRTEQELAEFIDNLPGGNVRLAIDILKDFLGSAHVRFERILDTRRVRFWELLRAVIYGTAEYFDPGQSIIENLFDVTFRDQNEHFLLPIAIGTIIQLGKGGSAGGFVESARIYERLQGIGFTAEPE